MGTNTYFINLSARYIPGKQKVVADQLSHYNQVIPIERSLLPKEFKEICKV